MMGAHPATEPKFTPQVDWISSSGKFSKFPGEEIQSSCGVNFGLVAGWTPIMRLEFLKSIKPDAEIQTTCDWHFGLVGRGTNISPEINESASELFNTFSDPKNILNKIVMKWALVPINFHCEFLRFLKIETFQHFRIMKFNQLAVWILAW